MTPNKSFDLFLPAARRRLSVCALMAASIACFSLLAVTDVLANAATDGNNAKPSQFEGSFDKLEVGTLGGWAMDASQPTSPIKVEVYDGPTLLAVVLADGYREDLKVAGKGDGRHAFNYALPASLRDGQSHTIAVRYADGKTEVPGSPKTLTFPKS